MRLKAPEFVTDIIGAAGRKIPLFKFTRRVNELGERNTHVPNDDIHDKKRKKEYCPD